MDVNISTMIIRKIVNSKLNFKALPKWQIPVDNRLVRGAAVVSPIKLYKMKKEGITQIIDLRNSSFISRPIEKFFCKILGIKYVNHKYPHRLSTLPADTFFKKVNEDIVNNKGKTYLHCLKGKRRTGICVAIYEKEHTNKTKKEIIDNVLNMGFQEVRDNTPSFKTPHLKSIFEDFIKKYYND